ncbi:MAG: YceI family protein [Gammaproteobacteria bacterium]
MRKLMIVLLAGLMNLSAMNVVQADEYVVDTEGTHAFIQFKIKHLGFSWLYGQFNQFTGNFSYSEDNPSAAKIEIDIDVASLDSNHAKRDKHLRNEEFLNVEKFPTSSFRSTSFEELGDGKAIMKGDFTLHGVTKNITIDIEHIGHGNDPWGGYRRGFYGTTSIKPAEFGITGMEKLGPHSEVLHLELAIEGIRQAPNPLK